MESKIREQVKSQLFSSGWDSKNILEEQAYSDSERLYRLDMLLTINLNLIAVIEIKSNVIDSKDALFQTLSYMDILKIPFGFIANGSEIFQISAIERELVQIDKFPEPGMLWQKSFPDSNERDPRSIHSIEIQNIKPRLFQIEAINNIVSSIISGKTRLNVQMSNGSGKTIVAFETCWKLIKSQYFKRAIYLTNEGAISYLKDLFSQQDWKVDVLSDANISQDLDVYITTLENLFSKSKVDGLLDRETVIFIDAGSFMLGREKFPIEFQKETFLSTLILLSSTELPWELSKLFGLPIFSYSFSQSIASELLQVPDGFEARKLDEIAEIRTGVPPEIIKENEDGELRQIYVIKSKDLEKGDDINIETLTMVPKKLPEATLDARFSLQENDILLSTMPIRGTFAIWILDKKIHELITFSSSLIRLRIDPTLANPKLVYAYLKSESGQSAIKLLATRSGTSIQRINVRWLAQTQILFSTSKKQLVSPASQVITQIQEQIVPKLKHFNTKPDDTSELNSIADQLRQMAIMLAPLPLTARILQSYPMPIALAFRKYKDSRFNVYEQVLRLRDVFEATSFYVYNIVLADVIHRLDPKIFFVEDKGARKAYNGYSMASRLDYIRSIIEIAKKNKPDDLFLPELINTTFVEQAKEFQENFRNRLSHSATATESQQQMVINEFEPTVLNMLAELEFLTKYRLVRFPAFYYKDKQWIRRTEMYHGAVPEIDEQVVLAENGLIPADKNHLILIDEDDQYLCLYPLYQLLSSKETRDENHLCFFKQRKKMQSLLEGESVQGAFEVTLNGYAEFENLLNKISESN